MIISMLFLLTSCNGDGSKKDNVNHPQKNTRNNQSINTNTKNNVLVSGTINGYDNKSELNITVKDPVTQKALCNKTQSSTNVIFECNAQLPTSVVITVCPTNGECSSVTKHYNHDNLLPFTIGNKQLVQTINDNEPLSVKSLTTDTIKGIAGKAALALIKFILGLNSIFGSKTDPELEIEINNIENGIINIEQTLAFMQTYMEKSFKSITAELTAQDNFNLLQTKVEVSKEIGHLSDFISTIQNALDGDIYKDFMKDHADDFKISPTDAPTIVSQKTANMFKEVAQFDRLHPNSIETVSYLFRNDSEIESNFDVTINLADEVFLANRNVINSPSDPTVRQPYSSIIYSVYLEFSRILLDQYQVIKYKQGYGIPTKYANLNQLNEDFNASIDLLNELLKQYLVHTCYDACGPGKNPISVTVTIPGWTFNEIEPWDYDGGVDIRHDYNTLGVLDSYLDNLRNGDYSEEMADVLNIKNNLQFLTYTAAIRNLHEGQNGHYSYWEDEYDFFWINANNDSVLNDILPEFFIPKILFQNTK
jgi:hypothetical protein